MVSKTDEKEFEITIEKYLTGISSEELETGVTYSQTGSGYIIGKPNDFDAEYALDKRLFWQFLESSQQDALDKLKKFSPNDWQRKIIERYDRTVKKFGILHLLKKGLDVDNAHFSLLYPIPAADSGVKIRDDFTKNIFSCMRQVHYSREHTNKSIDIVIFINGIPLITLELKNSWTGQTAQYNGQKQYKEDRDPKQTLLNFGRCIVHMAVDTNEIYMTTKLAGEATFFLPFNKGHNNGKGNPPNPNGHRTAYLWEDILSKESLMNIIDRFVLFEGDRKAPLAKKTLLFPRYQQLDVVRKLSNDVSENGVGRRYLIQHSAGSGKSYSITWLAYQLLETFPNIAPQTNQHVKAAPVFDSVIVVTDRRLLDGQLTKDIRSFSEQGGIVAHANNSQALKQALELGKKIIITTIQKFPIIVDDIADLSDKKFAVIIDEAHSSQSGQAHDKMNSSMGKSEIELEEDVQDKILAAMKSRKMRGNASYFAFTATPKNTTLEKFGEQQKDGSFRPFHLYSMKQAIEEGFILDVLTNYTTYKSFYEIQKSVADNPIFDTKKAQKRLKAFVERSQQTIDIKAEIILEHFIPHIVNTKKLTGKAKGMVITQSIETAIRYYKSIKRLLAEKNNPFDVVIAFSGSKEVDGIEYTETDINGYPESKTKEHFDEDNNRLLIVANKYLTGFDQPKLCAMYVDKKLSGVLCVQALSRLNRSAPKLGKKTEDLFILDFFNDIADIQNAFEPFYTSTLLSKATDINVLHELKDEMDDAEVYEWHEVENFVERYFEDEDVQILKVISDIAVNRFDTELNEEQKIDFKVKAKQFVKIYSQMAAIIPYEMPQWEKLFWYLKFLILDLRIDDPDSDSIDELLNSVNLNTYAIKRDKLNCSIKLDDEESELDPQNPNPRSAHVSEKQEDTLETIIQDFNERWFKDWDLTPEEQREKFVNLMNGVRNHTDFESKFRNAKDQYNKDLAFTQILESVLLKRRREELELYKRYKNEDEFKIALTKNILNMLESNHYHP